MFYLGTGRRELNLLAAEHELHLHPRESPVVLECPDVAGDAPHQQVPQLDREQGGDAAVEALQSVPLQTFVDVLVIARAVFADVCLLLLCFLCSLSLS